ncbi:hypothetical protein [Caloramator sp. Dgby_cultured_2]|uniref:hypothetical protein n=1 Tax=Caloramator sp. Dgby_cultured_2 TaxID=3029174 RepID=UPI00237E0C69|nr:hypothetical protein [Caloramator sp. Dgby_cultured_2]WDU84193.1 hypothetical protein PWK10_07700 [Caloramator sp. Dgby_cultured_2]
MFPSIQDHLLDVGKYRKNGYITDINMKKDNTKGNATEIWAKTDVEGGYASAVDVINDVVYFAHWVSDGSKQLRKLTSGGTEVWAKTTGFDAINGIAIDSLGNIHLAINVSVGNKSIIKLDSSGTEIWSKTDVAYCRDVKVDSNGNVYTAHNVAAGSRSVRKLNSSGSEIWAKTDIGYAIAVAVDTLGNVYVVYDMNSFKAVRKLDANGNEIWAKNYSSYYAIDVCVDINDNSIIVSYGGNGGQSIIKYDNDGNIVFQKHRGTPQNITADISGNIYVSYSGAGLKKFDPNGNEVWNKADNGQVKRISVDKKGYVYVPHYLTAGSKTERKLDGAIYYKILN